MKKVRHFIHKNDKMAPYSCQLFPKIIREVVVAKFNDFVKFRNFGVLGSLDCWKMAFQQRILKKLESRL